MLPSLIHECHGKATLRTINEDLKAAEELHANNGNLCGDLLKKYK